MKCHGNPDRACHDAVIRDHAVAVALSGSVAPEVDGSTSQSRSAISSVCNSRFSKKGVRQPQKGRAMLGQCRFCRGFRLAQTLIDPVAQYPGQGDALVWLVPEEGVFKPEIQVHPCRKTGRKRQVTGRIAPATAV